VGKVIGVGEIFLDFKGDKDALHKWYHEILGLDMTDYGTGFLEGRQLMLVSFKRDFENAAIINFRVDDIFAVVERLKQHDIAVKGIDDYDYGKFTQFTDPFGNLIELWEAKEDEYLKMVKAEIEGYKEKKG